MRRRAVENRDGAAVGAVDRPRSRAQGAERRGGVDGDGVGAGGRGAGGVGDADLDVVEGTGRGRRAADGDRVAEEACRQAGRQVALGERAVRRRAVGNRDRAAVGAVDRPRRDAKSAERRGGIDRDGIGVAACVAAGVVHAELDVVERAGGSRRAADGDGTSEQGRGQARRQVGLLEVRERAVAGDADGAGVSAVDGPRGRRQCAELRRVDDGDGVGSGGGGARGVGDADLHVVERALCRRCAADGDGVA